MIYKIVCIDGMICYYKDGLMYYEVIDFYLDQLMIIDIIIMKIGYVL